MNKHRWVRFWTLPTDNPADRSLRFPFEISLFLALAVLPFFVLWLKPSFLSLFSRPVRPLEPSASATGVSINPASKTAPVCSHPNLTVNPISTAFPSVRQTNISALVDTFIPNLTTRFSAPAFPEIHPQARLSRVPVIMYHDILPEKQVFFDLTPQEFAADLELIRDNGLTPITLDQLVDHLSTGIPLPAKPILLSFDDGYVGHYQYVLPLLREYGYPAVFAIYPAKVGTTMGRSSLTWEQLQVMARDPLVTIASHSFSHPSDLRELPNDRLRQEIVESKQMLEAKLGITINHFVYPEGKYDSRVERWVRRTGYRSALTMTDEQDYFASESENVLSIERIGQSRLEAVVEQANGGPPLLSLGNQFNFTAPVQLRQQTIDTVPLMLVSGGRPITVHADSRYQVSQILAETGAIAGVDGGFFSLERLDSNDMIGPVFSQNTNQFVPANVLENKTIQGRPLVLINPDGVQFTPYDPAKHNSLQGIQAALPGVTDAFVAAAWLVKDGQPQPASQFGNLFDFDAARDRAFWGIDQAGRPVVGASADFVDSVTLGQALSQAGLREAVMLDSGASASLVYEGQSMMGYEPRPVPHAVGLVPPQAESELVEPCNLVSQPSLQDEEQAP